MRITDQSKQEIVAAFKRDNRDEIESISLAPCVRLVVGVPDDTYLKYILCQVDSDCCILHLWTPFNF
ncbi:hypothetical protein MNBD_GAMMA12-3785 [hydrothermal vent metagenome]|uniref:Uncharacterized protein n=1 Tax=hydrothermal vent metagenome TaxID=652676 RepID=A0A3B0ZC95_9ZZZZ